MRLVIKTLPFVSGKLRSVKIYFVILDVRDVLLQGGIKCKVLLYHASCKASRTLFTEDADVLVEEANIGHALVTRILPD